MINAHKYEFNDLLDLLFNDVHFNWSRDPLDKLMDVILVKHYDIEEYIVFDFTTEHFYLYDDIHAAEKSIFEMADSYQYIYRVFDFYTKGYFDAYEEKSPYFKEDSFGEIVYP